MAESANIPFLDVIEKIGEIKKLVEEIKETVNNNTLGITLLITNAKNAFGQKELDRISDLKKMNVEVKD